MQILLLLSLLGLDQGYDALSFRPTNDRSPYVGLWSSEVLPKFDYTLSMTTTFANEPVNIENAGTKTELVQSQFLAHIGGSIGLFKSFMNFGFDAPVGLVDARTSTAKSFDDQIVAGDVRFNMKLKIVDLRRYGVGFGVIPFVTVPTGFGSQFMGSSQVTGGGQLILDSVIVPGFALSGNVGARFRKPFKVNGLTKTHELSAGVGFSKVLLKNLSFTGEVTTRTKLLSPFTDKALTGVEGLGAMRIQIPGTGVSLLAGGGGGILRGLETPQYRTIFGITYHNGDAALWN